MANVDDSQPLVGNWTLDESKFVSLLKSVIGEAKYVQNNPPEFIPKEDRIIRHILDVLGPYGTDQGGPLMIRHVSYVEGRGNLILEYPGTETGRIMSVVGCHMDVVPANPDQWDWDPFSLTVEGDKLCGRGTTDCLGHVALVTELFRQLAEKKPKLKPTIAAVFIANEENQVATGVGIDQLVANGLLDHLKAGPIFWLDTADKQPCVGTGGFIGWTMRVTGKLFHSGLPHRAINPLELAMEALSEIQRKFYQDFPAHAEEKRYGFATPSTMKPTQWTYPPGTSLNQIPGECSISGDCRITPFYDVREVMRKIEDYVDDVNKNLAKLPRRGPVSKYLLPDEGIRGKVEMSFQDHAISGVACNLDSPGYHALCKGTKEVLGTVKPFSITGSLPLIRDLQDAGFDVQITGYGVLATYHARNEYCLLSDMKQGFSILGHVIDSFNN